MREDFSEYITIGASPSARTLEPMTCCMQIISSPNLGRGMQLDPVLPHSLSLGPSKTLPEFVFWRCKLPPVMAEVDRIVRPGGKIIVRDESDAIGEVENLLKSLHWEVHLTFSKDKEGILSAQKGDWRPSTYATTSWLWMQVHLILSCKQ